MKKYKKNRNNSVRKKTLQQYIDQAKSIHVDLFDYSNAKLMDDKKINVWCNKHQIEFVTCATTHAKGNKGCLLCKKDALRLKKQMNRETFIQKAVQKHGKMYDYSRVEWKNYTTKIKIICLKHGEFFQTPRDHLAGCGCRKCWLEKQKQLRGHWVGKKQNDRKISKKFQEWIKSLPNQNDILIEYFLSDLGISVDGYDPKTNTVYEFHGDFWHGNLQKHYALKKHPIIKNKTFGELYEETLRRDEKIKKAGYNLIVKWG